MADFDDDDFDIDELLGEIDSGKGKTADAGADIKQNTGVSASGKSVRFSEESGGGGDDDYISKLRRSQRQEPSTTLQTMFLSNNASSQQSSTTGNVKPPTGRSARSALATGGTSNKGDWLGTQETKSSPYENEGPKVNKPESNIPKDSNSSDEEEALFKDIGLKPAAPTPRQRSANAIPDTPPISTPAAPPASIAPAPKPFSSSYLDQLGMSPPESPRTSLDLNKPAKPVTLPQFQPLPSSSSLLGPSPFSSESNMSSVTAKPSISKLPSTDSFHSFSLAIPSATNAQPDTISNPQQTLATLPKKKVVKGSGAPPLVPASTLQLPSHLINEEELKAMSSSLKTLYANQLDMQEKSYQEQMEFLTEANRRKEEMLKEEMKSLQNDYEERLDRLKNEIRELESKHSQKTTTQQDVASLASLSEQLNAGIVSLKDILEKSKETGTSSNQQIQQMVQQNLKQTDDKVQNMEGKVCSMVKAVDDSVAKRFVLMSETWKSLCSQIRQEIKDVSTSQGPNGTQSNEIANMQEKVDDKLNNLLRAVDTLEKNMKDPVPPLMKRLDESDKSLHGELVKLQRIQKKVKDNTDGIVLEPIVKILESDKDDEHRRREKLGLQLKDMKRDVKRILYENENRQESNQKYNMGAEMELKSISQAIRDLNSQLKFSLVSGPNHPDNLTHQFNTSMQQTHAEMEMKLLREERQAMSDSMAQVNVEKRKLSEEKVNLEKQKLDFEKEKDQLRNLEIQLKTKLGETEEIQRKTESVRREEIHLTSEAQLKLREVDNEKMSLRSKLGEAEQKLKMWEQKIRQDKAELAREREFMEKLRDQLLCPGCLKHNESVGSLHPPPPPYIQRDIPSSVLPPQMISLQPPNITFNDDFFARDNDFVDVYYRKLFD